MPDWTKEQIEEAIRLHREAFLALPYPVVDEYHQNAAEKELIRQHAIQTQHNYVVAVLDYAAEQLKPKSFGFWIEAPEGEYCDGCELEDAAEFFCGRYGKCKAFCTEEESYQLRHPNCLKAEVKWKESK